MKRWNGRVARAVLGLAVVAVGLVPATAASAADEIDGPWYIVNSANGRCLDAAFTGGGANGTAVQIWDCYPPTQYNQMWWRRWRTVSTFELINVASGTCLDVPAPSGGIDGTQMQIWDCYPPNQTNQMWRMNSAAGGSGWWFQTAYNQSNRVLDTPQNTNGTRVQLLYMASGRANEVWTLRRPNEF